MRNRDIIWSNISIYLPSLIVQLGISMTMAFNPLWSSELGANVAMVGLIAGGTGIGSLIFDLPGGWIGGRIREKPFMLISLLFLLLSAFLRAVAQTPLQLFFISILSGMSLSAWGIARISYLRRHVQHSARGRTMAYMGGIMRVARIAMPAAGGLITQYLGYRQMYFIQTGFFMAALILVLTLVKTGAVAANSEREPLSAIKETFKSHGGSIIAALTGIIGIRLLRMTSNVLFPLWADHIGIGEVLLGLMTSAGAIMETALVVPAGHILDHKGRKWAAIPCSLGMAVSIALIPLTQGLWALSLVYILMSLSNGIGSGINMTISSDFAPRRAAALFLGLWQFITDSSMLAGPLITGFVAASFSLSVAPLASSAIGIATTLVMAVGMKETSVPSDVKNDERSAP